MSIYLSFKYLHSWALTRNMRATTVRFSEDFHVYPTIKLNVQESARTITRHENCSIHVPYKYKYKCTPTFEISITVPPSNLQYSINIKY